MAGQLFFDERSAITLTSTGSSLTSGSAGSAGTDLDARAAGGTGNAAGDYQAVFELICQWATVTSITLNTVAAELYLVPKLDGTNLPATDTTAGSSALPPPTLAGLFICTKAPTANTDMRFISPIVTLHPMLYTAYILNRSGQTISANWTLKAVPTQGQYS